METNNQIEMLAAQTGISAEAIRMLAQGCVNSLIADGVSADQVEQAQVEIAGAYLKHEGRKLEQFTTAYMSKPEARKGFMEFVLMDLRGAA
jgi:hypothetical protein